MLLQAAGDAAAAHAAVETLHDVLRGTAGGHLGPRATALVRAVVSGAPGLARLRLEPEAVGPAASRP
jgi:hypothetical protein